MTEDPIDPLRAALEQLLQATGADAARAIVAKVGSRSAQAELDRVIARHVAGELLARHEPRSQIRERIVALGFSGRTAYRLLDTAKALLVPPAKEAASVAQAPGSEAVTTTPDPQPAQLEPSMHLEHLKMTRDSLRARLDSIDLNAARVRVAKARAAVATAPDFTAPGGGLIGVDPAAVERRQEWEKRATEHKAAVGDLQRLELEDRAIRQELAHLGSLIDAGARVDAAQQDVAAVEAKAEAAQKAAIAAAGTVRRVEALIAEEETHLQAARKGAAARLLDGIKAGDEQPNVDGANRDKLGTLEEAKAVAVAEKAKADADLTTARAALAHAKRALAVAQSDVTEVDFRHAERLYVEKLTDTLVAKNRARVQGFGVPDPRSPAMDKSMRIAMQEG